jgi:hypothetical protein
MFRQTIHWIWVALLITAVAAPSLAATYISPRGFSLEYPDRWQIASKELLDNAGEGVKDLLAKLGQVDFDKVAVAVLDPHDPQFANNLNVVISPGGEEFSKLSPDAVVDMLKKQYEQLGLSTHNMRGRWLPIGSRTLLTVDYDLLFPKAREWIHQRQYFVVSGDTVFVVTGSSLSSTFAKHRETFDSIVASIRLTE